MYTNAAYYNNSRVAVVDKSQPLLVNSCGTYRLITRPSLPTYRPKGRIDYQLIYIAAGKAHFFFEDEKETVVSAGNMVLYRPKEMQRYVYYGEENTEAFWVHFTGSDVKKMLKEFHFPEKGHVIYSGSSPRYKELFLNIMQELQACQPHYKDCVSLYLKELLIHLERHTLNKDRTNGFIENEMEAAVEYFTAHYNTQINVEEYAKSRNMSACWFIRNFKQYKNITPMQFILSLRIMNARHLLETTSYNITEISEIVGYENPLYFSRLFKKQVGMSPSEYCKQLKNNTSD